MKTLNVVLSAALLTACASTPQPPATATTAPQQPAAISQTTAVIDPVGAYEFTTVVDGQTVTGTMHVEGGPGNYKGRILTTVFPEIPIVGASVETNILNLRANMPNGELAIRMVMEGANFKGNWSLGADSGEISGKKLVR
jgi:hypothetical protein